LNDLDIDMKRLSGRRIIITGASGGLGREIAIGCHREGAEVLIVARRQQELEATQKLMDGNAAVAICVADVSSISARAQIVSGAWEAPDVLVNCAAVQGPVGYSWAVDSNEWRSCIDSNLMAPVALSHACIPGMIRRGGGKIINLSGGGATGPRAGFSAYATSKAALVRFSENLAEELKDERIDVNCLAPGAMPTEMLEGLIALGSKVAGIKEYDSAIKARETGAETIAKAVALCVYLASTESDGVTGKLISSLWDRWNDFSGHIEELRTSDIYTLRRIVPKDRGKDW